MSTDDTRIPILLAAAGLALCSGLAGGAVVWLVVAPSSDDAPGHGPPREPHAGLATAPEAILASMADLEPGGPFQRGRTVQMGGFSQVRFHRAGSNQRLFLLDVVTSESDRAEILRPFAGGDALALARTLGYTNLEVTDGGELLLDHKLAPWIAYRWTTLSARGDGSVLWLPCEGRPGLLLLYGDADGEGYVRGETVELAERLRWCR